MEGAEHEGWFEGKPGCAWQLFGELAADGVDDIHLTALEGGQPRCLIGDHPQYQASDCRLLVPILVKGFENQLYTRVNETNLYGPAPIGAFLKPSSPTFSRYFFGTIQPAPVAVP